jgi:hypothetical protein
MARILRKLPAVSHARAVAALLALAAVIRVAYFLELRADDPFYRVMLMDASRYDTWARMLAAGAPFEEGRPFHQAPLYPYLVSLVYRVAGPRPPVVFALQMLGGLVTLALVARSARRIAGPPAAVAAAALGAAYGALLFWETRLLTTSLVILLVALLLDRVQVALGHDRLRDWAVAGAVGGLASIANGALLLSALAVLGLAASRPGGARRRLARVGACAGLVVAAVLPVTLHNAISGRDLVLVSTNGGITFAQGNSEPSYVAGGAFGMLPGLSGDIRRQADETRRIAEQATGRPLRDSEVSSWWTRQGLRFIAEDPARYLALQSRRVRLLVDSYDHASDFSPETDTNPVRRLAPVPFALLLGLAVARWAGQRGVSAPEAAASLLVAAQVLVLLAFFVSGRYRATLAAPLLVLAGCGVATLLELRHTKRWAPAALAVAVAAWSAWALPWSRPAIYTMEQGKAMAERAGAFYAIGDRARAATEYRRAIAHDPRLIPPIHLRLAERLFSEESAAP